MLLNTGKSKPNLPANLKFLDILNNQVRTVFIISSCSVFLFQVFIVICWIIFVLKEGAASQQCRRFDGLDVLMSNLSQLMYQGPIVLFFNKHISLTTILSTKRVLTNVQRQSFWPALGLTVRKGLAPFPEEALVFCSNLMINLLIIHLFFIYLFVCLLAFLISQYLVN